MEQTTNHKAAPSPGVFLGEESILYTTGKTSGAKAFRVFFSARHYLDKIPPDGLFWLI